MKNRLYCNEVEKMSDFTFHMMKILYKVYYFFRPAHKYISLFGIQPGFTVVDYGSGTGAFLRDASSLVGEQGLVYAVDVHEMAVDAARKLAEKYSLGNIRAVRAEGYSSQVPDNAADIVYAIDMFHMVTSTSEFLEELNRITKKDGILIIEDGHQPRSLSKEKILASGCWNIVSEERRYIKCTPLKSS
jgi:ubiquinone/menaquinone biosynthesis C-methylase UbiE